MIRLKNVCFSYGDRDRHIVHNVNLEIPQGLTLLLGPNGCGKSTLLKLIAGVERPDSGSVKIGGCDLWIDEAAARQKLAFVPEQPDLTPYAAVGDVLMLVCRLRHEPVERGREVLKKVALDEISNRSIRELSMGQRRRVVLAAAWIGSPQVVLLDEPLESMDQNIRGSILTWIDDLLSRNATLVIVTHEIEPFVALASGAVTIRAGECRLNANLPSDPSEKHRLLDGLSRGI